MCKLIVEWFDVYTVRVRVHLGNLPSRLPDKHRRHLTCWRLHRGIGFASSADGERAKGEEWVRTSIQKELCPPSPPLLTISNEEPTIDGGGGQCNDTTGVVHFYMHTSLHRLPGWGSPPRSASRGFGTLSAKRWDAATVG